MTRRHARVFLFLQGPPGAFFRRLGAALRTAGHAAHCVHFHGGDALAWRGGHGAAFRGRATRWPDWFAARLARLGVTDLVLFGDCRPLHRAAIAIARARGVRVHVFEEGYLRPDWVTLERDGVNGHSTLPRQPNWYRTRAAALPATEDLPAQPGLPGHFGERARAAVLYYLAAFFSWPLYPHYSTHRRWHPARESLGWARRLLGRAAAARRDEAARARLAGHDYFLFPLQLDSDYQLRVHSAFGGLEGALDEVLRSFAMHAPEGLLLAVKAHPLDNGVIDWRMRTQAAAACLGIGARLVWFDGGDIAELSRSARGMVTVNSTSGTLALAAGVPVRTLGRAVYDLPGLTDPQPLADFWRAPRAPDPALFDAFRRVLAERCLLHGGFHNTAAIERLLDAACRRLLEAGDSAPAERAAAQAASADGNGRADGGAEAPA
ncbi:capsule biosynthesis protein [Cupriavidus sp. USMAA2-4]|uniref:capsule biosynthesis protein n=1 Tax=Cupriavidus sp. USMAA2-4 TaxID=876364 RepID=UPI000A05E9FD|nr:capsular biosynthesis protein [Cupriavidus sp. USMAA2-4]